MQYRVLGPLRVTVDGHQLPLGGPKQRLVLAMLLAADGRAVSTGHLIDGLWGDEPPSTARKMLQGYVHHLRSEIGDVLRTEANGYSLDPGSRFDAAEFEELAREARPVVDVDPRRAAELLRAALAIWGGRAYDDLADELTLAPEISRLENLRLAVLGDRVDADLACGAHGELIGELEGLTVEYPLDERFRAQHMTALYRAGRQVEALRAYERLRRFLAEEMGLEPSAELQQLEQRMLARDDSLMLATADEPGTLTTVRGYELRELVADGPSGHVHRAYQRSVGRQVAIRILPAEIADDPTFIAGYLADSRRIALLDHPNICFVFDAWREPGRAYQVSRWLDGGSLADAIVAGNISQSAALQVLDEIGGALAHAHRQGVTHGDLGPSKVLFDADGNSYLAGFALGAASDASPEDDRVQLASLAHRLLSADIDGSPHAANLRDVFAMAFDREGGYTRIEDFLRGLRRAVGVDVVGPSHGGQLPRTETRNPYKSLQAFQEGDADDFYGRDDLIDRLEQRLERARLVAVVGASGSGKSSVVKAGLRPRLRAGATQRRPRFVTEMYPGAFPFEELEDALVDIAVNHVSLIDDLLGDDRGLVRVIKQILPTDDAELVLVIDQFEELFSMVTDEQARRLFLDSLVSALTDPRSRLRVVLSMRADYFDRPLEYPRFGELLEAGLVPVSVLDEEQLARAIVDPARSVGVEFEAGLVPEIVRDVSGQPGGLPLLQYALTDLFDSRDSNEITTASYRANGGVLGALGHRAEELYEALSPTGRDAIHQAFLRLVSVDDGNDDVRRRVGRRELNALEVDAGALDAGLKSFGAHRLLTFDLDPVSRGPTVEVAHEALLREWPRLAGWIDDQREDLRLRRRLETTMAEWREAGEDAAFLPSGARLAQFDDWAVSTDLSLTSDEHAFLRAGRDRDAAAERAAASRRRRVMAGLAVLAVLASAFGVYALGQRGEAADEAYAAETARLGTEASFVSESNPQLALLMAVETYRRDPGFEGLSALQRVLVDVGPFLGVLGAASDYHDVTWVADDVVLGRAGAELHLIDVESGETSVLMLDVGSTLDVAASPAGVAAIVGAGGDVVLLDVADGRLREFAAGQGASTVALDAEGSRLAVGYPDGGLEILDIATGEIVASVDAHPGAEGVSRIVFDPAEQRIVTASGPLLQAWDAVDLDRLGPEIVNTWGPDEFNELAEGPRHVWFDGNSIVTVGERFFARWDIATGSALAGGSVPTGRTDAGRDTFRVTDAASAGEGQLLALSADGRVLQIDLPGTPAEEPTADVVFTASSTTRGLSVEPNLGRVAVASTTGIELAALDGRRLIADAYPIGESVLPTLSRDGSILAAGLASDGLLDISNDPPASVPFDINVEIAEFAGSPATFRFVPTAAADVLVWTTGAELVGMANAYDLQSGRYLADVRSSFVPAWSDDGSMIARAPLAGGTRIESSADGTIVFDDPRWIRAADFDSTASRAVVTFVDDGVIGTSLLVDIDTGEASELPQPPGGTFGAVFTPDDDGIVVVGGRGAVWLVDAETSDVIRTLQDADPATELTAPAPALTDDGAWMFSNGDAVNRVWHLESGRQLGQPFPTEPGGLAFARPDGDVLRLVTPLDSQALVWNLDMTTWVDIACRAAGRDMTEAEWERFGPTDTDHRPTCGQNGATT